MSIAGIVAIVVLLGGLALAGRAVRGMPTLFGAWLAGSTFRQPPLPVGVQEDDDFRWPWRAPRPADQGDRPEIVELPPGAEPAEPLRPTVGRPHHG